MTGASTPAGRVAGLPVGVAPGPVAAADSHRRNRLGKRDGVLA